MRKDVKTGMLAGTVLCFIAVVWFFAKQQIVSQPLIKFESPGVFELENNETVEAKDVDVPALPEKLTPAVTVRQHSGPDITENFIIHTVTGGQTLSDISKIYYDTPGKWKKIYEANKEQFPKGPDTVMVGMKLVIPK
jgi:hypothetical protein